MITIIVDDENALHAVLRALRHEWKPPAAPDIVVQMNPIPATRDVAADAPTDVVTAKDAFAPVDDIARIVRPKAKA